MPSELRRPVLPDTPELWADIENRIRLRAATPPPRSTGLAVRLQPAVGTLAVVAALVVTTTIAPGVESMTTTTRPAPVAPAAGPGLRVPPEDLAFTPPPPNMSAWLGPVPALSAASHLPKADVVAMRSGAGSPADPRPPSPRMR
jgi:hypothetical protein